MLVNHAEFGKSLGTHAPNRYHRNRHKHSNQPPGRMERIDGGYAAAVLTELNSQCHNVHAKSATQLTGKVDGTGACAQLFGFERVQCAYRQGWQHKPYSYPAEHRP